MSGDRSLSPTSAVWDGRGRAREKMATMANMGLHIFNPEWQSNAGTVPRGKMYSGTFKDTTLTILGTSEQLTFPVQTCTKVKDVKEALAMSLMVDTEALTFVMKQGCTSRKMADVEEMARSVTVKGIKSFKLLPHVWPHPIGIIGAGFRGLKSALLHLRTGNTNIIGFDRNAVFGGYCWITAANKTSKLQTELASFHVWSGHELLTERVSYPKGWGIWPYKEKVLEHFQWAAEQYGIHPHFRLRSSVAKLEVVGDKQDHGRSYRLSVVPVGDGGDRAEEVVCSVVYHYPGSMTRNRIIDYPGEDIFAGHIGYGMNDDTPYDHLNGSCVAILGNGAFAVENARTSCEYGARKVFLLTRRKNLASPRVACWFVHQGPIPTPGALVVKMFEPMYQLCGWGDPWSYFGVHASKDREKATIMQGSRFGIGDITFLAVAYGRLEYIQDTLKRMTASTLFLTAGTRLEDVGIVLKALGLLGDHAVDRFHKMKQVVGNFCDGDWRRVYEIDSTGMNAANFSTFSHLGDVGSHRSFKYLHDYPKDFYRAQGMGLMEQLPRNKANEKEDKPAHVTDVKFAQSSAMILDSMVPKMSQLGAFDGEYKYRLYHTSHPLNYFLEECKKSWDEYQETWRKEGYDHEYIPYPYTREMVEGFFADYSRAVGVPFSADGPSEPASYSEGGPGAAAPGIGQPPSWAADEGALRAVEDSVNREHAAWWRQQAGGHAAFQRMARAAA